MSVRFFFCFASKWHQSFHNEFTVASKSPFFFGHLFIYVTYHFSSCNQNVHHYTRVPHHFPLTRFILFFFGFLFLFLLRFDHLYINACPSSSFSSVTAYTHHWFHCWFNENCLLPPGFHFHYMTYYNNKKVSFVFQFIYIVRSFDIESFWLIWFNFAKLLFLPIEINVCMCDFCSFCFRISNFSDF